MKPWLWGAVYVLRYHLTQQRAPLICGLVLTNQCNLRCRHCRISSRGDSQLSFQEIARTIDSFYQAGGRCLYLHGGEPFLWHEGRRGIEEIVEYARAVGYFTVVIYTNGTLTLQTSADTVFVSLDGLQETHDRLRGPSFGRIMDNINASTHPALFVNFTVNSQNMGELDRFLEYVEGVGRIRGTFFYLHTPYYGHDDLCLEPAQRAAVFDRLLGYKRRYRILNSRAGLRSALRNDWRRPLGICSVYEAGNYYECCRHNGDPELCRNCGYLSYAEIDQTLKCKPSAIVSALKYF
jgi:MoaA/NifB/PqqE/SkfB family radical SAM enzyme